MASLMPVSDHVEMVRHSCGEVNPIEAGFCGGCGTDLGQGVPCPSCEHVGTPGARYCQRCGTLLQPATAVASADLGSRVAAIEEEIAATREDIQSLLQLKEQLDAALQRVRQNKGGPGKAPSRPANARPGPARPDKPEPGAGEPGDAPEPPPEVASANDALAPIEEGTQPAKPKPSQIVVVHLEERTELQAAIQATVAQYSTVSYHADTVAADDLPEGRPLIVANLLGDHDPLGFATAPDLRSKDAKVFSYATDGKRGFVIGMTELFPPPFDPEATAARLLTLLPATPRVLVVSGAVLGTPELRANLVRQGCTTSIAFDERQATGLIPSVRPNLVLIDLNLPRGEALRFAGRLRADPVNASTRIAFLWQEAIEALLFRQHAARAILDFPFSVTELGRLLMQEFNPGGAAYINSR